ncbi:hypothetical protein HanRHA438_Chr12g0550921 [Helianthus annuus]|nr:hypothetical protein HanRHA438_Chr12g0550921 [Helianthus annuus]
MNEHEQRPRSFIYVRERSVTCSYLFVRLLSCVFVCVQQLQVYLGWIKLRLHISYENFVFFFFFLRHYFMLIVFIKSVYSWITRIIYFGWICVLYVMKDVNFIRTFVFMNVRLYSLCS